LENIERIREVSSRLDVPVAILQDLSGPKIRIAGFADDLVHLADGDEFVLTNRDVEGNRHEVGLNHPTLPSEVKVGDLLLLADGTLELKVEETSNTDIRCRVLLGGVLGSNKGINLPSSSVNVPSLTVKDRQDLAFGLEHKVDYVALSFVRSADDVRAAKTLIREHGSDTPLIAKVEKHEALGNIDEIVEAADGLMVARGDLGIEIPIQQVPLVQKMVILKANAAAKPVITATQMLRSMVDHPRPTRAEVTDVANAVLDGADALMLSEETAMGSYPVTTVETMGKICDEAEGGFPHEYWMRRYDMSDSDSVPEALGHAVCHLIGSLRAAAVICYSQAGVMARLISKFRPTAMILGVTPLATSYRRMALVYGVQPVLIERMEHPEETVEFAKVVAKESGLVVEGDCIVITGGVPLGVSGTTNTITAERIT